MKMYQTSRLNCIFLWLFVLLLHQNVYGEEVQRIDNLNVPLLSEFEIESLQKCPCKTSQNQDQVDFSLCLPIDFVNTPTNKQQQKEVYVFSPAQEKKSWKHYDWEKVTTVAWNEDKELLCHAHKHAAKIVVKHNFDEVKTICDPEARKKWIQEAYEKIVQNHADGVNVDTEKAMKGQEAKCQTLLLKELRQELNTHPLTKNAQIVFDVSWAPRGIDGRYYDWKGLAESVDFFFVMSYDMRSQIYYQCIAGANTPLALVRQGLEEFLYAFDIPASKLVLGVAWYGYKYPCMGIDQASDICMLKSVPFFGAPCSDAAGVQLDYGDIRKILKSTNVQAKWDEMSQTPYLILQEQQTSAAGVTSSVSQIWYDDLKSLGLKYALAKDLKLRGVGMWHGDSLDYLGAPDDSTDMWRVVHVADPDQGKTVA